MVHDVGFLLPLQCGGCRRPGWALCPVCVAALRPAPRSGLRVPRGLDSCRALLAYEGPARVLVAGLKYANHRAAVGWFAEGLAGLAPPGAQLVTWAPTAAARRRERGYDQAQVVARALARRLGLPLRATLRRRGPQVAQTSLDRAARLANPAFEIVADVSGLVVVLVDDVATTGATLQAAGLALGRAGADGVHGLAVAATPDRTHDIPPTPRHTIGAPAQGPQRARRQQDLCA
jgi:predicted amidophosphoribosyltransferase